ncbi:TPA: hypothetical protein ACJ29Y_004113, partial [Salmonella enterica subsp. enterica serovar Heidelberg]
MLFFPSVRKEKQAPAPPAVMLFILLIRSFHASSSAGYVGSPSKLPPTLLRTQSLNREEACQIMPDLNINPLSIPTHLAIITLFYLC